MSSLSEKRRTAGARRFALAFVLALLSAEASAQAPGGGPPAVGVVRAEQQQITQSDEFNGRIQAVNRVALVSRVTGFLEKRHFIEGAEVKKGDLLYEIERPPFQALVDAAKANEDQLEAQHRNALITLQRAQKLLPTVAGQQSDVDTALANEQALAAQIDGAKAQLQTAQINLDYTNIYAPIDGKISATQVTEGNVVSPTSGTLANIVSQDPMYVLFPIPVRTGLDLRARYEPKGGFSAVVIKLRLPNGQIYGSDGKLDYASPTITENTDTFTLRGVVPNPLLTGQSQAPGVQREMFDGEFVSVLLEGVEPITVLAVPSAAVLSDQQGDYVYVVDAQNKAQVRRIQQGQSTPSLAVITNGLKEGELVITEGLQRVRPGEAVSPAPATPGPNVGSSGAKQ
ncbi:MAG TPA: efflux RND transporter periplasmic adaptor subunit [Stellaceae bacterium]|nr:efflux RND transporter periplasmic adaptor subunit [Stellaceae bacterium]